MGRLWREGACVWALVRTSFARARPQAKRHYSHATHAYFAAAGSFRPRFFFRVGADLHRRLLALRRLAPRRMAVPPERRHRVLFWGLGLSKDKWYVAAPGR